MCKCEYCGSIVDKCTNCPNCGAVLPRTKEVCVPCDTVLHIGPTADDLVYIDDEKGKRILSAIERFGKVAYNFGMS